MPASRFAHGDLVTILAAASVNSQFELTPGLSFLHADLTGPPAFSLDLPLGNPGLAVFRGNVRPALLQALRDGLEYRDCRIEAQCAAWRERYTAALEAMGARAPA